MIIKGFVDLQVNGLLGIDFSRQGLTLQDVRKVTLELIERGTVAYCPTLVTSPFEIYKENLAVFAAAMHSDEIGKHILGIHLEGPFISPEKGARGVHDEKSIREPSIDDFKRLQEWAEGNIVMLTLDPERLNAERLIRYACAQGVVVSLGHHFASERALKMAVEAGAKCSTHLGNAIPNLIPRHQNPLWWQLSCDGLYGTFITDGHHLPPAFIKTALRAKSIDKFIVISDASPLACMPAGIYNVFDKKVRIEESGRIYCDESASLAGSHSTMQECMSFLFSLNLLSEEELWKVSVENPLKLLGKSINILDNITPVSRV